MSGQPSCGVGNKQPAVGKAWAAPSRYLHLVSADIKMTIGQRGRLKIIQPNILLFLAFTILDALIAFSGGYLLFFDLWGSKACGCVSACFPV